MVENPRVTGSIPVPGTIDHKMKSLSYVDFVVRVGSTIFALGSTSTTILFYPPITFIIFVTIPIAFIIASIAAATSHST